MSVLRTSPWQSQLSLLSLDHGRGRLDRQAVAGRGKKLEYFTIAWNCLEGLVAVVAGAIAGSICLVGFGIDSFIEVTSGATCYGE